MAEEEASTQPGETRSGERHPVLEVFGIKLEVSNPRLAELLTMDAKEALTSDLRDLGTGEPVMQPGTDEVEQVTQARADAAEAAPDMILAPPVPRDEEEARLRREFRAAVAEVGVFLGFDARPDGVWQSPTSIVVLTRSVERPVSFAAATHYVSEFGARRESIAGPESTALVVVCDQQTADVFKVAIRQARLYHLMRTISLDNLHEIGRLCRSGQIAHASAVALLVPMMDIDVGEILSVVRAASVESREGSLPLEPPL